MATTTTKPKRKTLDELEASDHVGLPTSNYELCLAGRLNLEFERLDNEMDDLLAEQHEEEKTAPKTRNRVATKPAKTALDRKIERKHAEREKVRAEMSLYIAEVVFRAKVNHEWRAWVEEHPAREGNVIDKQVGYNFDALTSDLREFIVTVNDEVCSDRWWTLMQEAAAPGDWARMTVLVRNLHGLAVEVPKSWSDWMETRGSNDD